MPICEAIVAAKQLASRTAQTAVQGKIVERDSGRGRCRFHTQRIRVLTSVEHQFAAAPVAQLSDDSRLDIGVVRDTQSTVCQPVVGCAVLAKTPAALGSVDLSSAVKEIIVHDA